jgi:integrase
MTQLRQSESITALALEFCILTAARSSEVLGAEWAEIDPKTRIWTIPANRIKAGKEHRIPLSSRAMAILKKLHAAKTSPYVFEGAKAQRPLSSMAMAMHLRRLERPDITVHGFRSSFRDWVWEETEFPHELAEQALAHTIPNKSEAAYRRGDAIERRRAMMNAWADFCQREMA